METRGRVVSVCYFSNGTEGEWWMSRWCYRCVHDHNFHGDDGSQDNPCLHQLNLYLHAHDPVFLRSDDNPRGPVPDRWTCIEFSRCSCDRGPDDPGVEPPPPIDPHQIALFDADEVAAGVPADVWHDTFTKEPSRR
jgi:hypothetical protein